MNDYSFPDHVLISDNSRNIITKILNLDPSKRPTLDELLEHPFLNHGFNVPKLLPLSTLACPPSEAQKKQYPTGKGFNQFAANDINYQTQSNFAINNLNNQFHSAFQLVYQQRQQRLSNKNKVEVWMRKWVDYSSKYELGYLLSNGSSGVFFNDSTKIIVHPKGNYFEYIEKSPTDKQDIISQYTLTDFPKDIQKKVTLLQHFQNDLEGEKIEQLNQPDEENKSQPLIYLKKWMKTEHAIMFKLSNNIVQVNFTDRTEVILSPELKMLTYVNKKGERSNYPLATALESTNVEMTKRLKYTKEILTHMLNNEQKIQNQE
eukprot:TRINITY_DN4350_c0_g1_i3.p1 TRINITY_DN4350_c0_g1~~TRINITY_DN4350_c0_g1_i3.p1  ORF type:complete len:318 (+),score=41.02 TRINITY_DN4350_c0_g1_i3:645-1598(+)